MKEIIINEDKNETKTIMLVENGILIERYIENEETKRLEGNIYLGKIQNVLQGMQAAFVNIGENKNTFIHLKDILPKVDVKNVDIEEELEKNNIKNIAKAGMPILVQVKRDSTNKKGARVSTHINLPGRYLVYMPDVNFITVSQKIEDEKEKERLINIVKSNLPENVGIIIRTSAVGKSSEEIINDIKDMNKKWNEIKKAVDSDPKTYPRLIYKNAGVIKRLLIDLGDRDITKIIVNTKKQEKEVKDLLKETKQKIREIENNLAIKYNEAKKI